MRPTTCSGGDAGACGPERLVLLPPDISVGPGDALLVVDVQRDFLPGGALAVVGGDEVITPLNRYLAEWRRQALPVFVSRDWHPPDHCSFRARGGPWPPHCVAGTPGAAFDPRLEVPPAATVISKGTHPDREAHSAFEGTDLVAQLHAASVRRVFVGGLATEYCVRATACDALDHGFAVVVLVDAIRAIDVQPGDGRRAEADMVRRGAILVRQRASGP
jgi:nicotinamidase/pyrazinamidase